MTLHEDTTLFRQAIQATAQQMGINDIYVEKDYWVTLALHTIFHHAIGKETVFKGGTALSKCFGLIERFSEDIDLVILQDGVSGNQLKKKLKEITKVVATKMEETTVEGITNKRGKIRKIAYNYPKIFKGPFGQVRDIIVVEATWLGRFEPYQTQEISSYIYEMMVTKEQLTLAAKYNLLPFEVQVLDIKRTLCEKIMSLVRYSYSEDPITNLKDKIRHTYDIHQLLKQTDVLDFFYSTEFNEMLQLVGSDDVQSFKTEIKWLERHPKEALVFKETETVWNDLKRAYNNEFKELVYGKFPKDDAILAMLLVVTKRLQSINWNLTLKI